MTSRSAAVQGRTLRLRSQGVLRHRLSDEEEDLCSRSGRPFRARTIGRLHRPGSVCPQLRDLTEHVSDFLDHSGALAGQP